LGLETSGHGFLPPSLGLKTSGHGFLPPSHGLKASGHGFLPPSHGLERVSLRPAAQKPPGNPRRSVGRGPNAARARAPHLPTPPSAGPSRGRTTDPISRARWPPCSGRCAPP